MTASQQHKDWRVELHEWGKSHPKTEPAAMRELREEFLRRFPKENLGELTLEQYAEGLESKDTFCYWIEIKTRELGSIRGATAAKFGVWWSRRHNSWRWVKRYHDPEEAFAQIRQGLIELVQAAEVGGFKELDGIGARYLGSGNYMVRMKILSLYFPDRFLPIFSPGHLGTFLELFGLTPVGEVVARNRQLLETLQSLPDFNGCDAPQMARFLYDCFRPPRAIHPDEQKGDTESEPEEVTDSEIKGAKNLGAATPTEQVMNGDFATSLESRPELGSDEEPSDSTKPDDRPVSSQPVDWSISSLRDKWERNQIDLQPHYQREYVWRLRPELPSRLIESILLEIPIPPVYLVPFQLSNG